VIVHLSAALARRGHRVDLLQLHDWHPDRYAGQLRALDVAGVTRISVAGPRRPGRAAARIAYDRGTDLVHLHGAFNPSITSVGRALRIPYVFSPHSGYDPVSLQRSRLRKRLYRALFERSLIARAARIVALTDAEHQDIRAFGAVRPCDVIPNGVVPPRDDLDVHAFRRRLAISPEVPLAVFVGRLDVHRKGLDLMVRGVADASPWHLALVGPRFKDVERVEAMINDLRVDARVHLTGALHGRELLESMAGADVFMLLSRWEGFPMALLEAFSLGLPAIVSQAVDRAVAVEARGAGWVTTGTDVADVLRAVDRDELETRGRMAREFAASYNWDSIAEAYEEFYARAVEGTRQEAVDLRARE